MKHFNRGGGGGASYKSLGTSDLTLRRGHAWFDIKPSYEDDSLLCHCAVQSHRYIGVSQVLAACMIMVIPHSSP
jgi:hypothetical protein